MRKSTFCPVCNAEIDAHTCVTEEATPVEGDVSVCFKCGGWAKYNENLDLAPFTKKDEEEYGPDIIAQLTKVSDAVKVKNANLN